MSRTATAVAIVALCGALLWGCSTTQGVGAVGGAATGALIGGLASGNATGALIGAAAGAAAGWGAAALYEHHVDQSRTSSEDAEIYGYTPGVGPVVKIREATAQPQHAKPGETIQISSDYTVNASGPEPVMVSESWRLEKDGNVLHEFPVQRESRQAGGWISESSFTVPEDAPTGTYIFVNRIEADDGSEDRRDAYFVIAAN